MKLFRLKFLTSYQNSQILYGILCTRIYSKATYIALKIVNVSTNCRYTG